MKKITKMKAFTVLSMAAVLMFASTSLYANSWNLSGSATYFAGRVMASLNWNTSACGSSNVDVFRDGAKVATTANDGAWGTSYFGPSSGSANYWVCEAGSTTWYNSATCSNVKTLSW